MANFTIISELGRGGFGLVHQVRDASGAMFARKTFQINQNFTPTPDFLQQLKKRFEREARLQSGVMHKNIVPILEKYLDVDPPNFIMPLASSSLDRDIQVDRYLGGNYLGAISDIIAGLEELHSMKIYHRDLKPANVLRFGLPQDGSGFYAISDFGLIALKQTQVSQLTTVGMRMSSDFYTAPEITQDFSLASHASDIYSLGCILHDFVGTESRVPCSEIREPGPYSAILLSCTRKDPLRRFKSVSEVREAILGVGVGVNLPAALGGAAGILTLLNSSTPLTSGDALHLADYIEDNQGTQDVYAIFKSLSQNRIDEILLFSLPISRRIAISYADWIRKNSFIFAECDGLAFRLQEFLKLPDIEVQSECLLALLLMGTSHNRWYVERMFFSYVGSQLHNDLARRLAVEFRADKERVLYAIAHMENSISVTRHNLHQMLRDALL
ncbi:protein kinase domain-containing protein [Janthinobacterium sp. NFX145]|uniref:protein kinase domain-containing protein n=1 Tax=Janthinobacterium sp. NFX145 TaxID=3415602 RepID=UPI003CC6520C